MMTHVVERCPSCGVEHEGPRAGACEACQGQLRYWCRRHGRDAGWLQAPACPRCVEEAALPRPLAPVVPAEPAIPLAMFGRTIPNTPAPQRVVAAAPAPPAAAPARPAPKPESVLFSLATLPLTVTAICTFFALWVGVVDWVVLGGAFASVLGWGKTGLIAGAGLGVLADVFYLIGKLSGDPK